MERDREEERNTIKDSLQVCGYPECIVRSVQEKMKHNKEDSIRKRKKKEEEKEESRKMIVLPYISGFLEKVSRILKKGGYKYGHEATTDALRNILVHPKTNWNQKGRDHESQN